MGFKQSSPIARLARQMARPKLYTEGKDLQEAIETKAWDEVAVKPPIDEDIIRQTRQTAAVRRHHGADTRAQSQRRCFE